MASPSQRLPPILEGPVSFTVVVPEDWQPGASLQHTTPDGRSLDLAVPDSVQPGSTLVLSHDPSTGSWSCTTADAPAEPQVSSFTIVVPEGAVPGTTLQHRTADGHEMDIVVPENVPPGSVLTLTQDPRTQSWSCTAEPPSQSPAGQSGGQAVASAAAEAELSFTLVVPSDATPGTVLSHTLADGRTLDIGVPAGVCPGSVLTLTQDPASKAWSCKADPPGGGAHAEANADPLTTSVVVPADAVPGTKLTARTPDGRELDIAVPEGVPPGSVLTLTQDPQTKAWKCEAEPPRPSSHGACATSGDTSARTTTVIVPPGLQPGESLPCATPDGKQLDLIVPEGVEPGMALVLTQDPITLAWACTVDASAAAGVGAATATNGQEAAEEPRRSLVEHAAPESSLQDAGVEPQRSFVQPAASVSPPRAATATAALDEMTQAWRSGWEGSPGSVPTFPVAPQETRGWSRGGSLLIEANDSNVEAPRCMEEFPTPSAPAASLGPSILTTAAEPAPSAGFEWPHGREDAPGGQGAPSPHAAPATPTARREDSAEAKAEYLLPAAGARSPPAARRPVGTVLGVDAGAEPPVGTNPVVSAVTSALGAFGFFSSSDEKEALEEVPADPKPQLPWHALSHLGRRPDDAADQPKPSSSPSGGRAGEADKRLPPRPAARDAPAEAPGEGGQGGGAQSQVTVWYCALHNASEKRPKSEQGRVWECRGCRVEVNTNYKEFAFCQPCSAKEKRCMVCGMDANSSSQMLAVRHRDQEQQQQQQQQQQHPPAPAAMQASSVPPRYCQAHGSSEKRTKLPKPQFWECKVCSRQVTTNYASFSLCPPCSEKDMRCMICGEPALEAGKYVPPSSLAPASAPGHGSGRCSALAQPATEAPQSGQQVLSYIPPPEPPRAVDDRPNVSFSPPPGAEQPQPSHPSWGLGSGSADDGAPRLQHPMPMVLPGPPALGGSPIGTGQLPPGAEEGQARPILPGPQQMMLPGGVAPALGTSPVGMHHPVGTNALGGNPMLPQPPMLSPPWGSPVGSQFSPPPFGSPVHQGCGSGYAHPGARPEMQLWPGHLGGVAGMGQPAGMPPQGVGPSINTRPGLDQPGMQLFMMGPGGPGPGQQVGMQPQPNGWSPQGMQAPLMAPPRPGLMAASGAPRGALFGPPG